MIDKVMIFIIDRLNTALQQQFPSSEPHAIMAGGPQSAGVDNKVILSLANIERETAVRPGNLRRDPPGMFPPLAVNILVLVSANFGDNYAEGLKFLSSALGFFQSNPVFTPATSPSFPNGMEKFTLDFVNASLQELDNLWSIRGSLYLPSFLLKVRTVTFVQDDLLGRVPPVTFVDTAPNEE